MGLEKKERVNAVNVNEQLYQHFILIGMAITKKMLVRVWKSWNHCARLVRLLLKTVWWFLPKLHIRLRYKPAILLQGLRPKELKAKTQICVHSWSQQHYPLKPKCPTQMSIDGWTSKQYVMYAYSGVLFSFKRGKDPDRGYNVDNLRTLCWVK